MKCNETLIREKEKATFSVAWCGLWEIRTLDLFRVKEAL